VRRPHVDNSLSPIPKGANEEGLVVLSDILPAGLSCVVLKGKVKPGDTIAIVGLGRHIPNIGVHGRGVDLFLDKLWSRNIAITS